MTARCDVAGTSFEYPENWTLSEETGQAPQRCVTVQSPGTGFLMLQVFEPSFEPNRISAEVLRSVRQEYEGVEATEVEQQIETARTVGYDLQFYCLDFVVAARVRSFSLPGHTCCALCQAEDREFEKSWPIFLAILTSLMRGN